MVRQRAAVEAHAKAEVREEAAAGAEQASERDVVPCLQALGFRADEARRAAERCEALPDAPLEERVRIALSSFGARARSPGMAGQPHPDGPSAVASV